MRSDDVSSLAERVAVLETKQEILLQRLEEIHKDTLEIKSALSKWHGVAIGGGMVVSGVWVLVLFVWSFVERKFL